MYGWRARIGLVIPTNNTVIEPEFALMAPPGVSTHAARILGGGLKPEAIAKMVENSYRAVDELRAGDMSVIGYACLATSLVKGRRWTADFEKSVADLTARPVVTAATATIEALQFRNVTAVALTTPYPDHLNRLLPDLFQAAGIEIVSLKSVAVKNSLEVCRLPPWTAYQLAREADTDKAQAACILATDICTAGVLGALERDLGKPAISTNQALLWRALTLSGVNSPISGYGALLNDC